MNIGFLASVMAHRGFTASCLGCLAVALLDPSLKYEDALAFQEKHRELKGHQAVEILTQQNIKDGGAELLGYIGLLKLVTPEEFNRPQERK